jgi:hypothetical protein
MIDGDNIGFGGYPGSDSVAGLKKHHCCSALIPGGGSLKAYATARPFSSYQGAQPTILTPLELKMPRVL